MKIHLFMPAAALLVLAGCAVFSDQPAEGLEDVDHLLGRVERLHTEAQLSRSAAGEAVEALQAAVAPDQRGDATEVYADLVEAVEASEKRAHDLRQSVAPMESAAEAVFARWEADLEQFSGKAMRARSKRRLDEARLRFSAIQKSVQPALVEYDLLNSVLRDCVLYLGHDFNSQSVAGIQDEVTALAKRAGALDQRLERCMGAAEAYVRANALHGQVRGEDSSPESESRR